MSNERSKHEVYPPSKDVFTWTIACPINEVCVTVTNITTPISPTLIMQVKVVILGQDPYHGPGQAHGMCFSVRVGVKPPPSLLNIYKELESDIDGFLRPGHGYLMGWARQGVLLLNACLTVRARQPKSHGDKVKYHRLAGLHVTLLGYIVDFQGWEKLTDAVIHWLNDNMSNLVFLLWGKDAQKKGSFINSKKHHVLRSVHPSPLSAHRGFLGCRHFSQTNQYLREKHKKEIDWNSLPET